VYSPIAFLEDEGPEPSTLLENLQNEHLQTEGLSMALQQLDERSRRVLQARWLTEGNASTLHELAAEFNVSAERIRQIEQKAMQKNQNLYAAKQITKTGAHAPVFVFMAVIS